MSLHFIHEYNHFHFFFKILQSLFNICLKQEFWMDRHTDAQKEQH